MENKETSKIILSGCIDWKEFRDYLVKRLKKMTKEEEFSHLMERILFSMSSSEEEMQEKRRLLGIPET